MASEASSVPQAHKSLTAARCMDGAWEIRRALACCSASETACGTLASSRGPWAEDSPTTTQASPGAAPRYARVREYIALAWNLSVLKPLAFDGQNYFGSWIFNSPGFHCRYTRFGRNFFSLHGCLQSLLALINDFQTTEVAGIVGT